MEGSKSLVASEQASVSAPGSDREPPFYVVGVAVSAGKQGTLESFFDAMPADSGMAFVIIGQSSANGTHLTCEMLARHTELPIHDAVDGMAVEQNSIYLIPPHTGMVISGGRLRQIEGQSTEALMLVVDTFFCSLARDVGDRAIGVVLSSPLRVGSGGVSAIGEAGGMVIAVDETAESDAVPTVETDLADLRLPPAKIAEALLSRVRSPRATRCQTCGFRYLNRELKRLNETLDCAVEARTAELRASQERFALAVSGSSDGLWDWDVRTSEVYYAPRFKELLGYDDHEFENVFSSFESHLHPHDRKRTLEAVRHHLEDREPCDVEYRLRTKSGEYRWFRARGQAVWDDTGRAVRMAGSITDITKRKHDETALAQYAAEIQHANETLRVAEGEARKAVDKRDQFLAMLSHELRNPLSAMLNAVGVLEHTDADRQAATKARQAMRRQVAHMSRLLDDLLDVARITQGKIDFRPKVLDLNDLIADASQAVQPAIDARGQRFSVIPASRPVLVKGDPTRLLQIVENLLTNASRYTPPLGKVFLELKEDVDHGEVHVRDNGRGIDPDMLDEIFDMFFQSNNSLDRSDGGMGVGLTLVRALVEMHHGTVTAHSEGPGRGSHFIVRIPITSKPPAESTEQRSVAPRVVDRVLLVEDNPDSRDMLQAILTLDGFQVTVAEDGQQGLDAILRERPDVALIDIGLPGLDGYEVARRTRKELGKSDVQLVALTGYGQAKDREAVFQAGFDEHLVKPVNSEDLARVLGKPRKPR